MPDTDLSHDVTNQDTSTTNFTPITNNICQTLNKCFFVIFHFFWSQSIFIIYYITGKILHISYFCCCLRVELENKEYHHGRFQQQSPQHLVDRYAAAVVAV